MHTAFLDPLEWREDTVKLDADESVHLVKSVRAAEGDAVRLFDGAGRSAIAKIQRIDAGRKCAAVYCDMQQILPFRNPSVKLTLIQALPKGSRMDFLVEKAAELGVWEIIPVITDRVEKQPGGKGYKGQVERWRRIAMSAAKQCGSAWLPQIKEVAHLSSVLEDSSLSPACFLVGVIDDTAPLIGDFLAGIPGAGERAVVVIGPEGDLTGDEIRMVKDAGATPVNFGRLVLRVETAAIYAASVLKSHFKWDVW